MLLRCSFAAVALLAFLNLAAAAEPKEPQAIAPTQTIQLFNGKDLSGWQSWLKKNKSEDPNKVFTMEDGVIHVSGTDNGYLATDKEYRDYHLTVEYKWGKNTFGSKYVRNSGVLLHGTGPHGGAGGAWMSSIECQLAQGCVGDLIVIRGKNADGKEIPVSLTSDIVLGPDKHPRWKAAGEKRVFTRGQLWWSQHDPDYKELIDTRGKNDVESPLGEWTKVECICEGSSITILVNGQKINHCYDAHPSAGKILLQSEGFEMYFRKAELRPVKK